MVSRRYTLSTQAVFSFSSCLILFIHVIFKTVPVCAIHPDKLRTLQVPCLCFLAASTRHQLTTTASMPRMSTLVESGMHPCSSSQPQRSRSIILLL